jgi:hypothetical protein
MNALPFLGKSNRIPYKFYLLVVFALTLSMVTYVFPEELDITRYYENATLALRNFSSVIDYGTHLFETQIDFIYSSSLYLAGKNGIHMNVVTIFYMSLYYIAIFEVLRKQFHNIKISGAIFFYVTMFAPFIWVQSIARNFAAIAFFYIFISSLLDGKNIKAVFWLIVSVFTHISMLMYLPVILVSFLLNKVNINNKFIYLSILVALVLSYIVPSQLLSLISILMEGNETRYGAVYGSLETQGALMTSSIGYGDKIPIVFCLAYSVLLLFLRKSKDFMYWMLYVLTLMLSFFILSSLMFTNRVIMLMTLFVAYNAYKVVAEGKFDSKKKLYIASIIGCVVVFLHLYSYRTHFSL